MEKWPRGPRSSARLLVALGVVALTSVAVAACGGDDDGSGEASASGEDYRIVQVPTSLSDFTHSVNLGAQEAADELGAELDIQIPPNLDTASQTTTMDAVIASQPDAILLEPIDGEGMAPAVAKAKEAGITVVTYDSNVNDESLPDAFVAVDYVQFGSDIAATLDELVGGEGKLLHLAGIPGLPVSERIKEGYLEYVDEHPDLESLPIDFTQFETSKANAITEATITANPDLAGAFVGTQTELTGALSALNRANADQVKTISWDATPEAIKRLEDGELDRVISAPARAYGQEAVTAAVAVLDGEEPEIPELEACIIAADTVDDPENEACIFEDAGDTPF